ncbi:MAG: SDR family oxidoreductase [Bifidobacteriaceae bacterium]|nr:SDR family oxidoreductase [Bifidobacteriaceae bacterium]
MNADFTGRTAVVTGGANGLGAAIVSRLVEAGARVLILDRELAPDSALAPIYQVDLAEEHQVIDAARYCLAELGRVDVLVNCAGLVYVAALDELDMDRYHHLLAVALHAPVLLMREFSHSMKQYGYGRIVNITSVHSLTSEPGCTAYDVAKAGLEAATRVAAIDLAPYGVLANSIAPGFVATRLSVVDGRDELDSDWFRTVYLDNAQLPLRRVALPEEVAEPVTWLASEANTYTTGQSLIVDGGLSIRL